MARMAPYRRLESVGDAREHRGGGTRPRRLSDLTYRCALGRREVLGDLTGDEHEHDTGRRCVKAFM